MPNFGKASALKDELTPMLALVAAISCTGAWTFGWDNAWWSGILGNTYFANHFGNLPAVDPTTGATYMTLSASQQSTGTGIGTAGIMLGCMLAGQIASIGGRRLCMYAVSAISLVGVLIEVTAGIGATGRFYQMAVGKLFIGTAIGVASVSVPLYLAECSPATIRGGLVNFYVVIQSFGSLMAYCCLLKFSTEVGQKVWIVPIMIQLVAPILMVSFGWILPESPRWLVEKGRVEDARESLVRLGKGRPSYDPTDDLEQMVRAHEDSLALHGKATWAECFRGSDLRRTAIVAGVQCLQQGQGLGFMSNYLVVFLIQLGISNVYVILVAVVTISTVLAAVGSFTQDFFGRRALLVGGACFMGSALLSVAGITYSYPVLTKNLQNACIGLIFVWLIAFCLSWTNIPWTISSELPSNRLRDRTLTIGAWGGYGVGLIVTFVNPYLQDAQYANLGGGVGFVYGPISFVAAVFCYFFVPELKGVPLENVDAMFDAGVPARKMGSHPMRLENLAAHDNAKNEEKAEPAKGDEELLEEA